ncbi:LemA family protein [Mycoplasma leonicaptivi]|uniref:LemA family protein n=1 Tax=Mycoplasma leonicaptivi TaxID=36742 RepID=UPI000489BE12|nr:LemA family protein [Mycoplasma leonicaptivi]
MSNLFSQHENKNPEGMPIYADATMREVKSSTASVILFWVLGLFIFSGIYFLIKRNSFLKQQVEVNESASTIDTQLAKRADTLIKLVDQVKSYKEFESSALQNITRLRNLSNSGTPESRNELNDLSNHVFGRLLAVSENYPDLKSSGLYKELMEQSTYIEREIAAARRLYNSKVTTFNSNIFSFPGSVVASSMHLTSLPVFVASQQQRQDVSMKNL